MAKSLDAREESEYLSRKLITNGIIFQSGRTSLALIEHWKVFTERPPVAGTLQGQTLKQ